MSLCKGELDHLSCAPQVADGDGEMCGMKRVSRTSSRMVERSQPLAVWILFLCLCGCPRIEPEPENSDLATYELTDLDEIDEACSDDDNDGVCNDVDACADANDEDDEDEDGVPDACDVCPIGDDSVDHDEDGIPEACDCDELGYICHANAYCFIGDDGASCLCLDGYSGDGMTICENINECLAEPCADNASCSDNDGAFTCTCDLGYSGDPYVAGCTDIDECLDTPCALYASCTNLDPPGYYSCACAEGWESTNPETIDCTNPDECLDSPCALHASCTDLDPPARHSCACELGWESADPETIDCTNIDECLSSPCALRASCTDQDPPSRYSCSCELGWESADPETIDCTEIDECAANPCGANTLCTDLFVDFACMCRHGYVGDPYTVGCTELGALPGLILHYPFDGDTQNAGSLGVTYDGTPYAISYSDGRWNQAVRFQDTNSSRVMVEGTGAVGGPLTTAHTYTIGFWLRESDGDPDGAVPLVFRGGDGCQIGLRAGSSVFACCEGGGGVWANCEHAAAPRFYDWHHVLMRYAGIGTAPTEGANVEIFLDGVPFFTIENGAGHVIFSDQQQQDLGIGTVTGRDIDDLRIYNQVFDEEQQCVGIADGLWDFDSGQCIPWTVFQSASADESGSSTISLTANFWDGWRFEVPTGRTFRVTTIGFFKNNGTGIGTLFGAVLALDGESGEPIEPDLETAEGVLADDVLALEVFDWPSGEGDVSFEVDVVLEGGYHAILFGTGNHGASGTGQGPSCAHDRVFGTQHPFTIVQSDGHLVLQGCDGRFFVEGYYID